MAAWMSIFVISTYFTISKSYIASSITWKKCFSLKMSMKYCRTPILPSLLPSTSGLFHLTARDLELSISDFIWSEEGWRGIMFRFPKETTASTCDCTRNSACVYLCVYTFMCLCVWCHWAQWNNMAWEIHLGKLGRASLIRWTFCAKFFKRLKRWVMTGKIKATCYTCDLT